MNTRKFQVLRSIANRQYYFRLKAANGEIIIASEGYITKAACLNGIASVRVNAPIDMRYERKDCTQNYRFNLKAANGEIIARSEGYTSQSSRENGIASVKANAPLAPIEDITI